MSGDLRLSNVVMLGGNCRQAGLNWRAETSAWSIILFGSKSPSFDIISFFVFWFFTHFA